MPPALVHCQICRALLNTDFQPDSIEIPEFRPLEEIEALVDVAPRGYYVACPSCQQELRIAGKYLGKRVQCKICRNAFLLDTGSGAVAVNAFFAKCPHCNEELRSALKYLGMKVLCKRCQGHIQFVDA